MCGHKTTAVNLVLMKKIIKIVPRYLFIMASSISSVSSTSDSEDDFLTTRVTGSSKKGKQY